MEHPAQKSLERGGEAIAPPYSSKKRPERTLSLAPSTIPRNATHFSAISYFFSTKLILKLLFFS